MLIFLKKIFQRYKNRQLARQLRKPAGALGGTVGKRMNKANEFLYDFLIAEMKPAQNDHILEIGFGNGFFFEKIFQLADAIKISGIDYSPLMVNEAAIINADRVAKKQLQLYCGNSDHLPFGENSFDKIFCINVAYFWDAPNVHLQEIKRVLRPGGKFYTVIRTKESMQQMPFTQFGFTTYDAEEWETILTKNQFKEISTKLIEEPIIDFEKYNYQVYSLCIAGTK